MGNVLLFWTLHTLRLRIATCLPRGMIDVVALGLFNLGQMLLTVFSGVRILVQNSLASLSDLW